MIPIALATEDELSQAIALRLISELKRPHRVIHKLGLKGNGYLRSKMDSWCQMAEHQIMLVLTDLDQANCLVEFRDQWLAQRRLPASLIFRIAVREVESWVLADHQAMRELVGKIGVLPPQPDTLPDPKQALLGLGKTAPKGVRNDLIRTIDGQLRQGVGYNARLTHWINTAWSPERAAERSPSLARARIRIQEAAVAFAA
ncbi:MAG: hypothetical protein RL297_1807 [Pseudomonadota bacterium]|jgi:hypothetical protein